MRFFLLVILLSSHVHAKTAEQCMTEAMRLTIAAKIKGATVHAALGMESGNTKTWDNVTPADLCANSDKLQSSKSDIEEVKNTKLKMIKFAMRELKDKGKIDGASFDSEAQYLKENEICPEIDRELESQGILDDDCPNTDAAMTSKMRSHPFESSSFEKNCMAVAVPYLTARKECSAESKKSAEVKRDPPGEEIAPAEDEPVKVKLNKPVVDSVQPAKVDLNPKPRAGGSAQ